MMEESKLTETRARGECMRTIRYGFFSAWIIGGSIAADFVGASDGLIIGMIAATTVAYGLFEVRKIRNGS